MKKELTPSTALPALLIFLLAVAGAIPVTAAPAAMGGSGGTMSMPPPAMVLQQMHMVNLFEIKAAELAKQKTTATPIQRYANRLWRDHRVAEGKVEHLAKQLGFQLKSLARMKQMMMRMKQHAPMRSSSAAADGQASMQPMQKMQKKMHMMRQVMKKLQSASGPRFDQAYIKAMVKTHQKAVQMLEKIQAQKLDQPQVMSLVNKLLPILKQHLELAHHLQSGAAT